MAPIKVGQQIMGKSLEFWRYTVKGDSNNSRRYKTHPKRRQEAKTARKKFRERVIEMGYDPDVWTLAEIEDWGPELDDDIWSKIRNDDEIYRLRELAIPSFSGRSKDWFHNPPKKRGLFAFPPKLKEMFLVTWKPGSNKLRKSVISYNKPSLWCHLKEEAISLGIPILEESGHWVLIPTKDYERVLKKAVKESARNFAHDYHWGGPVPVKLGRHNLGSRVSLDRFEVFLII